MPQSVSINSGASFVEDLPINTEVDLAATLDADSYAWTLVGKPEGSTASLVDASTKTPTFTPDVEGSYLVKLVSVLAGVTSTSHGLAAVSHMKTGERIPAAGEKTQAGSRGWATALDRILRRALDGAADGNVLTCKVGGEDALAPNTVVRFALATKLKEGLPGEEWIPKVVKAIGTDLAATTQSLGVVVGKVSGSGSAAVGDLVKVRVYGPMFDAVTISGEIPPATPQETLDALAGSAVLLGDDGEVMVGGVPTNLRAIGTVLYGYEDPETPGDYLFSYFFDGGQLPPALMLQGLSLPELPDFDSDTLPKLTTGDGLSLVNVLGKIYRNTGGTMDSAEWEEFGEKPTFVATYKRAAESAAGDAESLIPILTAPTGKDYLVKRVMVSPKAAVTADDTDYATFYFSVRDSSGAEPSSYGSQSFTTRTSGSGGTGTVPDKGSVPLVFTFGSGDTVGLVLDAEQTLFLSVTKNGAGVQLPEVLFTVVFEKVS